MALSLLFGLVFFPERFVAYAAYQGIRVTSWSQRKVSQKSQRSLTRYPYKYARSERYESESAPLCERVVPARSSMKASFKADAFGQLCTVSAVTDPLLFISFAPIHRQGRTTDDPLSRHCRVHVANAAFLWVDFLPASVARISVKKKKWEVRLWWL